MSFANWFHLSLDLLCDKMKIYHTLVLYMLCYPLGNATTNAILSPEKVVDFVSKSIDCEAEVERSARAIFCLDETDVLKVQYFRNNFELLYQ